MYIFFLHIVKVSLETKRSRVTFFRHAKMQKKRYTAESLENVDRTALERTDIGYNVFETIRGTAPYFTHAKQKVMAIIRQLGLPTLFVTLSAAERHWDKLIRQLLEKEWHRGVTAEEVAAQSPAQRRKMISRNMFDTNIHFHHRIRILFNNMKSPGIFQQWMTKDFFFRIEFQQRGSVHVHSILWIVDQNRTPAPNYTRNDDQSRILVVYKRLPTKHTYHRQTYEYLRETTF